jgi:ubiquinone/menaquinone biosynthesis C-methylase UbiE
MDPGTIRWQRTIRPDFPEILSRSLAMNLLAPARHFDPEHPEMIDRAGFDRESLREELQLLEYTNRRFGGHALMLHYIGRFLRSFHVTSLNLLDLGTGAADVPRAIVGWARNCGVPITVTAVDGNSNVLGLAEEWCRDWPEICLQQFDLRELPYAAASFDLVLCSLTLHHFGGNDAIAILRRIREIARFGCILNDLRRNWLAIWASELMARTVMRDSIFREDAPQSCRAAFTVRELRDMAAQAGFRNFRVKRHHAFFRMVLEERN